MSRETSFCGSDASLAAAAECMWRNGVGFLPVVGEGGNVIGVITDRDISIALGTGRRKPSAWPVQDVMGSEALYVHALGGSSLCLKNTALPKNPASSSD
jgi:CBS domain-containing protein